MLRVPSGFLSDKPLWSELPSIFRRILVPAAVMCAAVAFFSLRVASGVHSGTPTMTARAPLRACFRGARAQLLARRERTVATAAGSVHPPCCTCHSSGSSRSDSSISSSSSSSAFSTRGGGDTREGRWRRTRAPAAATGWAAALQSRAPSAAAARPVAPAPAPPPPALPGVSPRHRPAQDGKRFVREVQRLGAQGNWRGVLALLKRAEEDGAAMNHIMYNASIATLAKSGRWKEAISILDGMPAGFRDDRSFASAIDACRVARRPDEAYAVLRRMGGRQRDRDAGGKEGRGLVSPTVRCFNTALSAFAKEGQSRRALSLVDVEMARAGVTPDLRSWSSVIDAYRAGGESGREAAALLERMRKAGAEPDIWCFNHCLNAAGGRGEWELAFDLLERMGREGVEPNSWSYSAVMKACTKAEEWSLVPALLETMRESGSAAPPNVWHFNICIDAHAKSGEWERAVALLRHGMPEAGVAPDIPSYASAMHAAQKAGEWGVALDLWDEIAARRRPRRPRGSFPSSPPPLPPLSAPNDHAYGIAIDVCAKAGLVDRALSLLAESHRAGLAPSLIRFNSAIDACARAGRWEQALALVREIREAGLRPDEVSFTSAMAGFPGQGDRRAVEREVSQGLALVEEMRSCGLPPTNFTHSAAIALCAAANEHERAMELLEELTASGETPNQAVFTAAIGSCSRKVRVREGVDGGGGISSGGSGGGGGGVALWETALSLLDEMEAVGVAPKVMAYNAAIRACCDGGRWDLGRSMLGRMALAGVEPDTFSMNALVRGLRPE